MRLLIILLFSLLGMHAQELTITLKTAEGQSISKTISGPPVAAGLEVLEAWRLTQCTAESEISGPPCKEYRYATIGEALQALIVGQIMELSKRFPTSATASERAAERAAAAALEAKRKALFDAALPESK